MLVVEARVLIIGICLILIHILKIEIIKIIKTDLVKLNFSLIIENSILLCKCNNYKFEYKMFYFQDNNLIN